MPTEKQIDHIRLIFVCCSISESHKPIRMLHEYSRPHRQLSRQPDVQRHVTYLSNLLGALLTQNNSSWKGFWWKKQFLPLIFYIYTWYFIFCSLWSTGLGISHHLLQILLLFVLRFKTFCRFYFQSITFHHDPTTDDNNTIIKQRDQHLFSPYKISTLSRGQVMRIKTIINWLALSWCTTILSMHS